MKTRFTFFLTFTTILLYGQQLYIGGQAGVNIGTVKQDIYTYLDYHTNIFANYTYNNGEMYVEKVPVSFAEGMSSSINIGYMKDKIGVELCGVYMQGMLQTAINDNSATITTYEVMSQNTSFIPALIYKSDTSKFVFVAKIGITLSSSIINNRMYSKNKNTDDITQELESTQTGKIYLGEFMAMGIEYNITKRISLKTFLSFNIARFKPQQVKLNKYEINGTDQMPLISDDRKTKEYLDKIKYSNNNDKYLTPIYNMSNIGFHIGIYYNIYFNK